MMNWFRNAANTANVAIAPEIDLHYGGSAGPLGNTITDDVVEEHIFVADTPEVPKKAWQHGYDMAYLKVIETCYTEYNLFSSSPFSAVKKNTIAKGLHEGTLSIYGNAAAGFRLVFDTRIAKARSEITMYRGVALGLKEKGDRIIKNLAWKEGENKTVIEVLTAYHEPCWLYVWAEDQASNDIAIAAGFAWTGTKITTFGELMAIYFREGKNSLDTRQHPGRYPAEDYSIEQTSIDLINWVPSPSSSLFQLIRDVEALSTPYTTHYSNYNKDKAWAALSLRGYTSDPAFITKPEEMNKKWKKEHEGETFELQDTALRRQLPHVEALIEKLPGVIHRVRLMSLAPNGGELQRHTDQVDPDSGVTDGKLMRFHFPLVTNPAVIFSTWGVDGVRKDAHMRTGECWYIDVRKPHAAINNGKTNRIHLVVDVEANDKVRGLLENAST